MKTKWGVLGALLGLALAVIMIQQGAPGLAIPWSVAAGVFGTLGYQRWHEWR